MTAQLRGVLENRLWRAGLTLCRTDAQRHWLRVAEYPRWRIRCHQTRSWFLWALFAEAQAENPDLTGSFSLITEDRRADGQALATFGLELLEAWLAGERPAIVPRRKRRSGFAHHRLLEEVAWDADADVVPVLVSRQVRQPILVSVPLARFRGWLDEFPAPRRAGRSGEQLTLSLWSGGEA